jgi:hypothetical protein
MTKQIMERQGYEHDASDIRLNSVPFYKASRYRRRDQAGVYLFQNSSNPRDICATKTRKGEKLPRLSAGRWIYVNYLSSPLKAAIGYDLRLKVVVAHVDQHEYFRHQRRRVLRSAS